MIQSVALFLFFLIPGAHADWGYARCKSYLECAKTMAAYDRSLGGSFGARSTNQRVNCEADLSALETVYGQWFFDHESELNVLDVQIAHEQALVKNEITKLASEEVEMNPTAEHPDGLHFSFSEIADYFRKYNELNAASDIEGKMALAQTRNDARKNFAKITHSDIVDALDRMTSNINSALKQLPTYYEVKISHDNGNYFVRLAYTLKTPKGELPLSISLLEDLNRPLENLGEAKRWEWITRYFSVTGPYSIDGKTRYRQMQNALRDPRCYKMNWLQIDERGAFVPYVRKKDL